MKTCKICGLEKEDQDFYAYTNSKGTYTMSYCKQCSKEKAKNWARSNIKKIYTSENNKQYRKRYAKVVQERRKSLKVPKEICSLRDKFFIMYGDKCACCGEAEKVFLCLDHKKGMERRLKTHDSRIYYRDALKSFDPDEYQVLCMNCNHATSKGKICPHQQLH